MRASARVTIGAEEGREDGRTAAIRARPANNVLGETSMGPADLDIAAAISCLVYFFLPFSFSGVGGGGGGGGGVMELNAG